MTIDGSHREDQEEGAPPWTTAGLSVPVRLLRRGDVLLYRRSSLLGRAIRLLDGGTFSHAALYLGDGQLVEAIGHGVRQESLSTSLGPQPDDWIATFRRQPMKADEAFQPVVDLAKQYVSNGTKYAFHDVFLCAGLALTRRLPLNAVYKAFLRKILDGAAGKMIELAQQGQARPLMCSELVFLCFHNAPTMPQGALSLAIAGLDVGGNNSEAWLKPTGPEHGSLLDLIKRRSSPADLPDAMRGPTRDDSFSEGTATLPDDFALLLEACESSPPSSTESTEGTLDADTAKSIQGLAEALRQLETPARGEPSLDEGLRDPPGAKDIEKWLSHFVSPRDLEQSPTLEQVGRLILT